MPAEDIADKTFKITPRTSIAVVIGIFSIYFLTLSTFVTNTDFQQANQLTNGRVAALEKSLNYHLEESTILQIEQNLTDVSDKRWDLKQRLQAEDGNTRDNRQRDRELEKRENTFKKQLDCLRAGHRHCLNNSDPY